MRFAVCFTAFLLSALPAVAEEPLLVILTETGREREKLPVLAPHPDGKRIATQLDRGIAGELIRVYRRIQIGKGIRVEPAYLLLSTKQGGFARYGFWLGNEKKADAAYIDVHRDWEISGRFGAIDQIFPHELGHAIFHLLGIDPPDTSGANQIHAVAVRTDRFTAFNEGFAEHFQVMAVDHSGAAPATRALADARDLDLAAQRHLAAYRSELSAPIAPATRMRIGFPLWYSNDERVLRYFAVKRNEFVREPRIPEDLLTRRDRFDAYLLENTLPGDEKGAIKSVGRLIASEGALSAFFHRWATNGALQQRHRDAAFYERFGTTAGEVTQIQNVYMKLFHAMEQRRPRDASALVAAYKELFPDEAALLDAVVADAFHVRTLDVAPEIWLANSEFRHGTTIFDQFRGAPRAHTFDLNAASIVDLTSVPGVTLELARTIARSAPYASIDDLARVPGVSAELLLRLKAMIKGMDALRAADEENLSMQAIFLPYLWRAGIALLLASIAGALLYRLVRGRAGVLRMIASGLGAALVGVIVSWITGNIAIAIGAVIVLFGIPSALWQLYRNRSLRPALASLGVWAATALPAVIVTTPWV
jgi:DNA uptake protein ComE-like DNA-binding protein